MTTIKKRPRKIKQSDLTFDDEALHEMEIDLMMHEVEDKDFHHLKEEEEEEEDDGEEPLDEDEEDIGEKEMDIIRDPTKTGKLKYYIQPKEFDDEIMKYYESGHISDELAIMIDKIANKLSFSPNFINYSFKSDMIGDAVVKMMKALIGKKYQHVKGRNPFSYYTRIAFNSFICRIKKEKHTQETHDRYKEELLTFSENYNTIVKNKNLRITPDQ